MNISVTGYEASDDVYYRYPLAGDDKPAGGAKVLLLTVGGVCVVGQWRDNAGFTAWSPMPKRNRTKESSIACNVANDLTNSDNTNEEI